MKKILLLIFFVLVIGCASEVSQNLEIKPITTRLNEGNSSANLIQYEVIRVIDGDTVELANGERLRYNDIDTPETVHPSKPIECYGPEASAKNKELVEGKIILVELGNPKKDKYGRMLGYVYVNQLFINAELVKGGYAEVNSYGNPGSKLEYLYQIESISKKEYNGMWGNCVNDLK